MDDDKIDDYLMGHLEGNSLQSFLKELNQNPDLAKEVAVRREALAQIEHFADQRMKSRIKAVHQQQLKKGRQRWVLKWTLVSLLIFFLLAALGWWFLGKSPDNIQLYEEHHQVYALNFGSRDQGANEELLTAGAAYRRGDFAAALSLFQNSLEQTPNDTKILFAIGLCQQQLKQDEAAIQRFSILINNDDPLYGDPARWYAALSQLRLKNTPAATNLLQPLVNDPGTDFHEEATQLLMQIK